MSEHEPSIMNQFQAIDQVEYSNGAMHLYGVDETGKKQHISERNLLESYGYTPENVADGLQDTHTSAPESPEEAHVQQFDELTASIDDAKAATKERASWQMKVDTTDKKPSERELSTDDIAYNMWLEDNAADSNDRPSTLTSAKEDLQKKQLKDLARLGMRVKTGVATADEIGYYYDRMDAAEAAKPKTPSAKAIEDGDFEAYFEAEEAKRTDVKDKAPKATTPEGKLKETTDESVGDGTGETKKVAGYNPEGLDRGSHIDLSPEQRKGMKAFLSRAAELFKNKDAEPASFIQQEAYGLWDESFRDQAVHELSGIFDFDLDDALNNNEHQEMDFFIEPDEKKVLGLDGGSEKPQKVRGIWRGVTIGLKSIGKFDIVEREFPNTVINSETGESRERMMRIFTLSRVAEDTAKQPVGSEPVVPSEGGSGESDIDWRAAGIDDGSEADSEPVPAKDIPIATGNGSSKGSRERTSRGSRELRRNVRTPVGWRTQVRDSK